MYTYIKNFIKNFYQVVLVKLTTVINIISLNYQVLGTSCLSFLFLPLIGHAHLPSPDSEEDVDKDGYEERGEEELEPNNQKAPQDKSNKEGTGSEIIDKADQRSDKTPETSVANTNNKAESNPDDVYGPHEAPSEMSDAD
jgi:hypothetical protein